MGIFRSTSAPPWFTGWVAFIPTFLIGAIFLYSGIRYDKEQHEKFVREEKEKDIFTMMPWWFYKSFSIVMGLSIIGIMILYTVNVPEDFFGFSLLVKLDSIIPITGCKIANRMLGWSKVLHKGHEGQNTGIGLEQSPSSGASGTKLRNWVGAKSFIRGMRDKTPELGWRKVLHKAPEGQNSGIGLEQSPS